MRALLERLRKRRYDTGQALVEMALVLPILCVLLFAVIDMGYALFVYSTLYSATREGVRIAAINDPTTTQDAIKNIIVRTAPGLNLKLTDIHIDIRTDGPARAANGGQPEVRVRVDRLHQFFGPLSWFGTASINMSSDFRSAIATWPGNENVNY